MIVEAPSSLLSWEIFFIFLIIALKIPFASTPGCLKKFLSSAERNELTNLSSGDSNFGDQLSKVSGNLSELNNVYEMQLKGASDHLKAS